MLKTMYRFYNLINNLKKKAFTPSSLIFLKAGLKKYHTNTDGKPRKLLKTAFIGITSGVLIGTSYAAIKINEDRKKLASDQNEVINRFLTIKPEYTVSRKVLSEADKTNLKLTLFQYQTCPFCCKVRTLLDYYGFSYDVVEVDPVFKGEIKWSEYRKVPILLVKAGNKYLTLTDSSMITSSLVSYLHDPKISWEELLDCYPTTYFRDSKGKLIQENINKYFIMYKSIPDTRTMDDVVEERKWRIWVDEVLVHTLSPNVYRTLGEAYKTFQWFSVVGNWGEIFPLWERTIIIYVGAFAMWLISKKLKKKYNLKDDVQESFHEELKKWLYEIKVRGSTFMGGKSPNLADLAVYGILKSIEGCTAFEEALENKQLKEWYTAVMNQVDSHAGAFNLNFK